MNTFLKRLTITAVLLVGLPLGTPLAAAAPTATDSPPPVQQIAWDRVGSPLSILIG